MVRTRLVFAKTVTYIKVAYNKHVSLIDCITGVSAVHHYNALVVTGLHQVMNH